MTDRFGNSGWGSRPSAPVSDKFKKRSNSNIGKGSILASNPRVTEEYAPRSKRTNPLTASALTPQAFKRPMDSSFDDDQQRLDDMMLYNSQKHQKLLSNDRPRLPPPSHYSPQRYQPVAVKAKPEVDRRSYFDEQDYIRDQVNKIWIKHDINRSGALDKIETANFLWDFFEA